MEVRLTDHLSVERTSTAALAKAGGPVYNGAMNAPLRVPASLLRRLGRIAAESKRDVSTLAEDALRQFVRSHEETVRLTSRKANARRLRAAHREIEAEIARRTRSAA